jgi:hypothetical protein
MLTSNKFIYGPLVDEMKLLIRKNIGKSVKILDKVGARTSALKALKALEKLGAAQITHLKNLSSFKQLKTHIIN